MTPRFPAHAWMRDRTRTGTTQVRVFTAREVAYIRLKYWTGHTPEWIAEQFGTGVDAVTVRFVATQFDSVYVDSEKAS